MTFPTRPVDIHADLQGLHLTGSPVTVLPMTRRWISDVPSKIVKIYGAGKPTLVSRVCAGKCAHSSVAFGLWRADSGSAGRVLLPICSQGAPTVPHSPNGDHQ